MITLIAPSWYQKQEMLNVARSHHFIVTEGLFKDWVNKGLLGGAEKREWPGRGSSAWWPSAQLHLFLRLLAYRQREQNKIGIGPLCNIVIGRWLYWGGELSGISLNQVKKAMKTWMDYQRNIPETLIRKNATQMARIWQGSHATDKRALIDELTAIGTFSKSADPEVLRCLLEPVVNAQPKKAIKGLMQERLFLVDDLSSVFPVRLRALQDGDAVLGITNSLWHWARIANLDVLAQYQHEQPLLASDPDMGDHFERVRLNTLCDQSCMLLLTTLGAAHQNEFPPANLYYCPALHPQSWQRGEVTAVLQTQIVYSLLNLPNGRPLSSIRHEVVILYQGTRQRFIVDLPCL